ncbi:NAD(P)/FAD-dependent oxidoreductase [Primorskyibacter sp. 2E107]|uniref:NAD(P)/FAD-dependent oxidoreductase n=1 Tax=Primorskyibacter sp. 2E107 TaxID=3403458 RepID=UPI003AF6FC30
MEDVVIIGGGLSGASLLYACQQNGLAAVMLEEKVVGGAGATAHSRGMVRVYDPQPELAEYAAAGLAFWEAFGADNPEVYAPIGLAYFLKEENIPAAEAFLARMGNQAFGMRLACAGEIAERCPALNPRFAAQARMAIWEPKAGHINPRVAARALSDRAQSMGAGVIEGVRVLRVVPQSGHMRVETGFGALNARRVIVATGAAPHLLDRPQAIETRSIVLSSYTCEADAHPNLCLIDEEAGCYLRPGQPGHFYVGGAAPSLAAMPDALAVDTATAMAENTAHRRGLLNSDAYDPLACHVGHDGYTADFLPLLQEPGAARTGAFCGFSGRGAKYIPALAQTLVSTWKERGAL